MSKLIAPLVLLSILLGLLLGPAPSEAEPEVDRVARAVDRPGVGRLVAVRSVTDVAGKVHAVGGSGPVVFAMTSPTCPLSKKYAPSLARLSGERRVIFVDVNGADTAKDFAAFAAAHGWKGVLVHDPKRALAATLGATSTTEVFLVDGGRTLVYRGALDDQYGIGYARDAPRKAFLADALKALEAGRRPAVPSTSAPGCALELTSRTPAGEETVTWHGTVQRIVQANCQRCHRAGGLAPFALETRKQVVANADMISWVVREGLMPPWFASEASGPFANDCSLSARDKKDLLGWLKSDDKPAGDPKDAPSPRTWPEAWTVGPDHVVQLPREVKVRAEGTMPYVNLRVPLPFKEDRWVTGWEVRPTARDVVHHVLVFAVPRGRRGRFGARSGFLAAYVPGNSHARYPAGLAKKLPANSDLWFQLHYTPNGKATVDRTMLGLRFARTKPKHEIRTIGIANTRIRIPAGAKNHVERARLDVPLPAVILGMMPHMHYRGKSFKYELVKGESRSLLLDVPKYDFNWQLSYFFERPRTITAGSQIQVTATYDNSDANPANPDPHSVVRWGDQSNDEMLIGYLEYYFPSVPAGEAVPDLRRAPAERVLRTLDANGDGKLSRAECPPRLQRLFTRLDRNKDGFVDLAEVKRR